MKSLWTKSAEEDPDKITLNAKETLVFHEESLSFPANIQEFFSTPS